MAPTANVEHLNGKLSWVSNVSVCLYSIESRMPFWNGLKALGYFNGADVFGRALIFLINTLMIAGLVTTLVPAYHQHVDMSLYLAIKVW